jgi:hypothetical protein
MAFQGFGPRKIPCPRRLGSEADFAEDDGLA